MYNPGEDCYCESSKYIGKASDVMHDWEIIKETTNRTLEHCKRCGLRETFYKADNNLYLKTHKRDFLQPTGATAQLFAKEYGKANYDGKQEQGEAEDGVKDLEI